MMTVAMHSRNLADLHRHQAESLGHLPAIRYKRYGLYYDVSHQQYFADALACAAALVEHGIGVGDRVGLVGENRLEWLIADMGILAAGAVNVTPHAPLTGRQIQFQLADAGAHWLFVSSLGQWEKIRPVLHELPDVRRVVVFDALPSKPPENLGMYRWRGFLQRGRQWLGKHAGELSRRAAGLSRDDLATIMYTSGTTGHPKGVMLTHGNLLSNAEQVLASEPYGVDEIQLNWLPFSHIYARTMDHYRTLAAGVVLALAESADTLVENLDEIRPTQINSVPRFYEKVLSAVSSSNTEEQGRRLQGVFGPRIDVLCSGGAPLPVATAEAYHAAGLKLLQGYGLTESSPVISFNRKCKFSIASVGPALPGVEVMVADDGELLSRGPHIMKGYWNNPTATAEAIEGGWLHTGDIARIDDEGFIFITGRKKELLILSNGKKVVPNFIEGLLLADPCIDQVMVCGEGRSYLTALLIPHWDNLRAELELDGTPESLTGNAQLHAFLKQRVDGLLTEVSTAEQVKKIAVLAEPFSVAGDELTVSLKLRRSVIEEKFRSRLEQLYGE